MKGFDLRAYFGSLLGIAGWLGIIASATGATGTPPQTVSWVNSQVGSWTLGSNWSSGMVPTSSDSPIFRLGEAQITSTSVTSAGATIQASDRNATVTVSNGRWTLTGYQLLVDGLRKMTSTLNITNQGTVSAPDVEIGNAEGTNGVVNVSTGGSLLAQALTVGSRGKGDVLVTSFGRLQTSTATLGAIKGATGSVILRGQDANWSYGSTLIVGAAGTGTLTVADNARLNGGLITLGNIAGGIGTLNIGEGHLPGFFSGLMLVQTGKGKGTVNFNHNASNYASFLRIAGSTQVNFIGPGSTNLYGSSSYTGGTQILAGTVRAFSSTALGTGPVVVAGEHTRLESQMSSSSAPSFDLRDGATFVQTSGELSRDGTLVTSSSGGGHLTVGGSLISRTGWTVDTGSRMSPGPSPLDVIITTTGTVQSSASLAMGLLGGGSITNQGRIVGATGAIFSDAPLALHNDGTIAVDGTNFRGDVIFGNRDTTLDNNGSISGSGAFQTVVRIQHGGGITNQGVISGSARESNTTLSIDLASTVENSGEITGRSDAVNTTVMMNAGGAQEGSMLRNSGHITGFGGTSDATIWLTGPGELSNSGTISGESSGMNRTVVIDGLGKIFNDGIITGNAQGSGANSLVELNQGGSLTNQGRIGDAAVSGAKVYLRGGASDLANTGRIYADVVFGDDANSATLAVGSRISGSLDLGANTASSLVLAGEGTQLYSEVVTGRTTLNGTMTKQGTSIWIIDSDLTPRNTIIAGGELQIGNRGKVGNLTGSVVDNGVLSFARSDDLTFAGSISGSGAVVQKGPGTLKLTGSNSYTGGTRVEGGYLLGDARSLPGGIANEGTLIFNERGDGQFEGDVSGSGGIIKKGPGTLIVNHSQHYTGTTDVLNGALQVDASLASDLVNVHDAGALTGNGTLLGDVFNAGLISPGHSPGQLNIGGNFTQSAAGSYLVQIASRQSYDRLVVGGKASLAGKLSLSLFGGYVPEEGDTFSIVTAKGGVKGRFDSVEQPAIAKFALSYSGTKVLLTMLGMLTGGASGGDTVDVIPFTDFAQTPNQRSVAGALDAARPSAVGDLSTVISGLDLLPADELRNAFDEISPELVTSFSTMAFTLANAQNAQIEQRLSSVRYGARGVQVNGVQAAVGDKGAKSIVGRSAKDWLEPAVDNKWSAFVSGSGTFANAASIYDLPRYHFDTGTLLSGIDYAVGAGLSTGVYAGYTGTRAKYATGSSVDVNGAKFGLYGTYERGGYYVNASIGGGANSYRMNRNITFGDIDRTARSRPDAGELDAMLGGGKDWQLGAWTLGVTNSLQYTYLGIGAFQEQGADSLNVRVAQQNANSLRGSLGGRIAYTVRLTSEIRLVPELRLSWQHEFLDYGRTINAWLENGDGPQFAVYSDASARNNAFAGAGATLQVGNNWTAYAFYNPQFGGGDVVAQTISCGLNWKF